MLGRLKDRFGRSLSNESTLMNTSNGGDYNSTSNNGSSTGAASSSSATTTTPTTTTTPSKGKKAAANGSAGLHAFDACVEACDALAGVTVKDSSSTAAGTISMMNAGTSTTAGDCSVRVSPDGDLLLLPEGTDPPPDSIVMGHDVVPDKRWNGFSAMGWSAAAASLALRQTQDLLSDSKQFISSLNKVSDSHQQAMAQACSELRTNVGIGNLGDNDNSTSSYYSGGMTTKAMKNRARKKTAIDYKALSELEQGGSGTLEPCPHRVGPLAYSGSSLYGALVAVEQYYSAVATNPPPTATAPSRESLVQTLQGLVSDTSRRAMNREHALRTVQRTVSDAEESLRQAKRHATRKWEHVHAAEETVTAIMERRMMERNRAREQARLERLHEQRQMAEQTQVAFATDAEIWSIVAAATASMEEGDFAPLDLPTAPMSGVTDLSSSLMTESGSEHSSSRMNGTNTSHQDLAIMNGGTGGDGSITPPMMPIADRVTIEQECNLPELRSAALRADDAIEDAAQRLLNALSSLDTTKRSARVAAEACLLSACTTQKEVLSQLCQLEKQSLLQRMENLHRLEEVIDQVDVRSDLGLYITVDKKERGGSTWMGDDDDGGVASALAVLSSHVEGSMGLSSSSKGWTEEPEDDTTTPEALEDAVDELFDKDNINLDPTIELLCKVASDQSARSKRSTICYALNAKRTSAECPTQKHFDALCKVFDAILTGCDHEAGGVANAKMCMMLSQTFYIVNEDVDDDEDKESKSDSVTSSSAERSKRIYVKSRLIGHGLWKEDEFWDQTLYQCVTESLTHSGVMQNFDRPDRRRSSIQPQSEWTQTRKLRWHDLTLMERSEAASQVHAVVFAQLGALAHSMMEFGCGMERSCAFVRRMSVRNQLPISQRTMLLQHLLGKRG